MHKDQQEYVDGVRLWIRAQRNLADQIDAAITYNRMEVEFHQKAIENDTAMLKHYVAGLERAEIDLAKYLNETPE